MTHHDSKLDDWVSLEVLSAENPSYPLRTLRYLCRAEMRRANGLDKCVRYISSRHAVISRSRFAAWISSRGESSAA